MSEGVEIFTCVDNRQNLVVLANFEFGKPRFVLHMKINDQFCKFITQRNVFPLYSCSIYTRSVHLFLLLEYIIPWKGQKCAWTFKASYFYSLIFLNSPSSSPVDDIVWKNLKKVLGISGPFTIAYLPTMNEPKRICRDLRKEGRLAFHISGPRNLQRAIPKTNNKLRKITIPQILWIWVKLHKMMIDFYRYEK